MGAEIRAHVGLVRFSSHLQVLRSVGVGAGVDVQRAFDWLRRNDGNIICPFEHREHPESPHRLGWLRAKSCWWVGGSPCSAVSLRVLFLSRIIRP